MTHLKQLSYWAKDHRRASRFIIVFSFLLINASGLLTGLLLNQMDMTFSKWFLVAAILVFSFAWLTYPDKKHDKIRTYSVRKTCDLVLIGTTFLMFIYFGNRRVTPFDSLIFSASAVNSFTLPKDSTKTYKSLDEFGKSLKNKSGKPLKWKERKKLLKQQVKAIKNDKTMSDGGKVALIILCVLLALVLTYGVAALACSLSCAGSEGAAVIVAVLGMAGIVLLTFFVIRSILRKSKREKAKEVKEAESPTNN